MYQCDACRADMDDNFSLCDSCFAIMPVDRMVSAGRIADMWVELSEWAADSGFTLMDDGDYENDDTGDIWMRQDLYVYMVEVTA